MDDLKICVMGEKIEVKWVSGQPCGGPQKQQTPWQTEWDVDLLHGSRVPDKCLQALLVVLFDSDLDVYLFTPI